jgi:site-specific DNA-methyltransferase (adenine-specific)
MSTETDDVLAGRAPWVVVHGDCRDADLPDDSVDCVVYDPPYGLSPDGRARTWDDIAALRASGKRGPTGGLMGASWDAGVPGPSAFKVILKAMKPGAYLLAFGSTRTSHRLAGAIEDAGFEICDAIEVFGTLHWIYSQGWPKGINLAKAFDKAAGIDTKDPAWVPVTDAAKAWDGWNTELTPAHEPVVVAQKPFRGTFINNALRHGVGGLHIDACRVATTENLAGGAYAKAGADREDAWGEHNGFRRDQGLVFTPPSGRYPKNVVFCHLPGCVRLGDKEIASDTHSPATRGPGGVTSSGHQGQTGLPEHRPGTETVAAFACAPGCPVAALDAQSEVTTGNAPAVKRATSAGHQGTVYGTENRLKGSVMISHGDTGTAARFYPQFEYDADDQWPFRYCAKPAKSEKTKGCEDIDGPMHLTCKPVSLIRWLVKLVCPPGGVVYDPFCGSGGHGVAARLEGMRFIGKDIVPHHIAIANARIAAALEPKSKTARPAPAAPPIPAPPATETLGTLL